MSTVALAGRQWYWSDDSGATHNQAEINCLSRMPAFSICIALMKQQLLKQCMPTCSTFRVWDEIKRKVSRCCDVCFMWRFLSCKCFRALIDQCGSVLSCSVWVWGHSDNVPDVLCLCVWQGNIGKIVKQLTKIDNQGKCAILQKVSRKLQQHSFLSFFSFFFFFTTKMVSDMFRIFYGY